MCLRALTAFVLLYSQHQETAYIFSTKIQYSPSFLTSMQYFCIFILYGMHRLQIYVLALKKGKIIIFLWTTAWKNFLIKQLQAFCHQRIPFHLCKRNFYCFFGEYSTTFSHLSVAAETKKKFHKKLLFSLIFNMKMTKKSIIHSVFTESNE